MKKLLTISLIFALLNLTNSCNNDSSKKIDSIDELDLSSPRATVQTFINAAKEKDEIALSYCFSKEAEREFHKEINLKLSYADLEEYSEMADGAEVISIEEHGEQAVVEVKFKNRDERISLIKNGSHWLIANF